MSSESIESRISDIDEKVEDVRCICLIKNLKRIYNYCNYLANIKVDLILMKHELNNNNDIKIDFESKYLLFA